MQPLEGEDYLSVTLDDMNEYRMSNLFTAYLANYPSSKEDSTPTMITEEIAKKHVYDNILNTFTIDYPPNLSCGNLIQTNPISGESNVTDIFIPTPCSQASISGEKIGIHPNYGEDKEIIQIHPISGGPKETNICIQKSDSQLSPSHSFNELAMTDVATNSLCGELCQLVRSSTILNRNLEQSKSVSTISGCKYNADSNVVHSLNTVDFQSVPRPFRLANIQTNMNPMEAYCLNGILQPRDNTPHDHEHQIKSEYFPSIEPEPPPYTTQHSLHSTNCCDLYGMQPSVSCTIATYHGEYIFIFFMYYRDSALIHPYKIELIMDQLDLQNSYCYEWGVIYLTTSEPLSILRSEATPMHLCSTGSDRNYPSISIGVLHHAYHVTCSEVTALHLCSMGSDRNYLGISIQVLHHVNHTICSFVNTYSFLQNGE